jgi:hypothetical protein
MRCRRCAGRCVPEQVMIDEGELALSRCVNCGHRVELGLLFSRHLRPAPPLLGGPREADWPHRNGKEDY